MPYDPRLLFAQLCVRLDETPARSLLELSREFGASSRTIQSVVASMTNGVKFSSFRSDILIARLTRLFVTQPVSPINKISFELGYKSTNAFSRAVRRACGVPPAEFRNRVLGEAGRQQAHRVKASAAVN